MNRREEALVNQMMRKVPCDYNESPFAEEKKEEGVQQINLNEVGEFIEMIKVFRDSIKKELGLTEEEHIIEYIRMFLFGASGE